MKQKNKKTLKKKPLHILIDSDDQKLLEKKKKMSNEIKLLF